MLRPRLLCLPAILLAACSDPDAAELERSRTTFLEREAAAGGVYAYTRTTQSWAGFGTDTTLTVEGGVVVQRDFAGWTRGDDGARQVTTSWTETGAGLGSHTEGASVRTLLELYGDCERDVLSVDRSDHDVIVRYDADHILRTCVYVAHGCADDCSTGIELSSVRFGR